MKTQVEKLKHSEIKLTVELSEEKLKTYRGKTVDELQSKVKIAGFREGKIPAEVLERHLGEQAFLAQVLDIALSESYEEAVLKEKIRPVAYPKINIVSHSPLKYEATIPVIPDVTWKKDIAKLSVKPEKLEVSKKEMDEVLNNLRKQSAKWTDVTRAAALKDRVEIDFDGFDMDKVPLDGTSSKNHPVILGEKSLIPGFEEEIVGMKIGEEKDFNITFPKDYHSEKFKNKKVRFHIKLNRIEEPEERKLDDEFANEITGGNRKTLAELEEEIKMELMHQKEHQEEARIENEFLKKLLEYVDADLPEALVEREIDFMIERIQQDLEKQGKTLEAYQKELEEKGKKLREELKKTAREQVLIRLGLEKLYEDEKVEVSESELEIEVDHTLSHYPAHFAPLMAEKYKPGNKERELLRNQMMLRKVVENHSK